MDVTVIVGDLKTGFFVEDDGPGIPGRIKVLFSRDHSQDGAGTGLGLAVLKRVAEAHGWELNMTASETGGVSF